MIGLFIRRWFITGGVLQYDRAKEALEYFKIKYREMVLVDKDSNALIGFVFEFDCPPGLYILVKKAAGKPSEVSVEGEKK